jgi:hypothetical protein
MKKDLQKAKNKFFMEVKMIEGAIDAVFELSDEFENCVILSGKIYGDDTNDKISELGRKNGLLIMAKKLSVMKKNHEIRTKIFHNAQADENMRGTS